MNTTKIIKVSIKKLWGIKDISTSFHKSVNIFIGANGTNKTTFLNLIEASLICDIQTLNAIKFERIDIYLSSRKIKSISIYKKETKFLPLIIYELGNEKIEIPYHNIIIKNYRTLRYEKNNYEMASRVKSLLKNTINVSWLSINRGNLKQDNYDSINFEQEYKNMIDIKLNELQKNLILYQLQLDALANNQLNAFKKDILSLMLYNPEYDTFDPDLVKKFESIDIKSMQQKLFRAFSNLGIVQDKDEMIKNHIKRIKEAIKNILHEEINTNDVYAMALINRTLSIIKLSEQNEEIIKNIYRPIKNFWVILKNFMTDKNFSFNKTLNDIEIFLKESNNEMNIDISSLSSGEKQLFILLAEALLQKEETYLFLADEPELSLHIDWQNKILKSILSLNPNVQIIVATHSPEIASSFPDNIINMKNIIFYE